MLYFYWIDSSDCIFVCIDGIWMNSFEATKNWQRVYAGSDFCTFGLFVSILKVNHFSEKIRWRIFGKTTNYEMYLFVGNVVQNFHFIYSVRFWKNTDKNEEINIFWKAIAFYIRMRYNFFSKFKRKSQNYLNTTS